MTTPEDVLEPETDGTEGGDEDEGGLTAGQIEWLGTSAGQELVDQVLDDLLGKDE